MGRRKEFTYGSPSAFKSILAEEAHKKELCAKLIKAGVDEKEAKRRCGL